MAAQCSIWLRSSPAFQPDTACLLSALRALRISHVWEDTLCVWRPKLDVLQSLSAPLRAQDIRPALLIQVLDSGDTDWLEWLGRDKHNYAHLLRVTIPRNPAFLAVKATLKDLAAYSADFVPPEALDTLASYLLSWAATIAPFEMLTAEQLLLAAASDDGALQAARGLSLKQRGGDLTFATARHVLVQNLCRVITRAVKQAKEGPLLSSIVQRFLLDPPLRLLVLLLGRLLPLLRSTATPGAPLLEASGKTSGKRAGPARIMHTMAKVNPHEHSLVCFALSADVCGLRHFRISFRPAITSLAHFHPLRRPPQGSKPDGNTHFPAGTLLLLEVSFAAPHAQGADSRVRHLMQGPATIEAIRGRHGFTLATAPLDLPEGPCPTAENQHVRTLDPESSGAQILLSQGQWTYAADTRDLAATAPRLLPFVVHEAKCVQPKQRDPAARKRANEASIAAPWALLRYFLDPVLFEMLARTAGCHCLLSPFMCLGGVKLPCTPLPSKCTMSCALGILRHLWSGAACSIPPQQGSPLLGVLHSSHFPCLMISHHLTWFHPPSGLLVRALLTLHAGSSCPTLPDLPGLGEALPIGSQMRGWLASCLSETPAQLVEWLAAHALSESKDLHLLSLAAGVLLSLLTHKTELIVRGVYGAGKTQCIALLAAFFGLRGHHVYYASRQNTTIVAMATFVQELLPRAPEEAWPIAIRLLSQPQARTSESTDLDARDTDRNQQIWNAKLVLATTGLHLAQFRQQHRPLANAVDYAELFIYDEAQQEAALSDLAILGALPRKCLVLRLGDPKQTSVGTGPSDLARKVRLVSDQLALGIRAPRKPYLPQAIPALIQSLLRDDLLQAHCPDPHDVSMVENDRDADVDGALCFCQRWVLEHHVDFGIV